MPYTCLEQLQHAWHTAERPAEEGDIALRLLGRSTSESGSLATHALMRAGYPASFAPISFNEWDVRAKILIIVFSHLAREKIDSERKR